MTVEQATVYLKKKLNNTMKKKKKFITCLIVFKLSPLHPNKKLWFLKRSCFP